ncbi:transposase [uncultured Desulfosarcina sp.]|uniref:transposase n=1 Tax=uncultured Desulfosarcina sp. TaxID=218289 RepID=UPI0029C7D227|nr:transposase [uncultured Desulfosarcina sp.]
MAAKRTTKVVKVPVRIADEDESIRLLKYRALDKVMYEARYLGNMAIRYAIAFNLKDVRDEFEKDDENSIPLDTRIYRILTRERKHLAAGTVATLGRNFAGKLFRNANKDAWAGRKSLPTYRSLFVPFRHQGSKINPIKVDGVDQFVIEPSGFTGKWLSKELITEVSDGEDIKLSKDDLKLSLTSTFSWKDKGASEVVSRIVSGDYKMSDSQIQKNKKGLMVYLTYSFVPEQLKLDPKKVCGVDLGAVVPAVCAVNFGPQRRYIGDGGDVWAARSKFRAQRRRSQRRLGMYSKTIRWKRSDKEDKWIHTYYHTATRQVIKFCLQHQCGTIHVEDLSKLRQKDMESEFKRLLWIPSKFNELLDYKAKEEGIEIVKVNPRNTSRRCSKCGHIAKENRKSQSQFVCEVCGNGKKPVNADYNAARNLALAEGNVIKEGYIPSQNQEQTA